MIVETGMRGAEERPRRAWFRRRIGVLLAAVGFVAIAGTLAAVVVVRSSAPPTLVPGLSDQRPDPARGISGGSFPMGSNVSSIELGTFLCGTRDVEITSVSLFKPSSGIVLARWGLENHGDGADVARVAGPLTQLGSFTSHTISARCHATDYYARVGLELHRTQPATQSFLGLRMTYESDGRQKVAYLGEQYRFTQPRSR